MQVTKLMITSVRITGAVMANTFISFLEDMFVHPGLNSGKKVLLTKHYSKVPTSTDPDLMPVFYLHAVVHQDYLFALLPPEKLLEVFEKNKHLCDQIFINLSNS